MNVSDVISQVRYSIDEAEGYNGSDFEDTGMDAIIKAKMTDALRWCMLYGEGSMLSGSDTTSPEDDGYIKQVEITVGETPTYDPSTTKVAYDYADGWITLPADVLKVTRVKNYGQTKDSKAHVGMWYKSVMNTIDEDSDPYLMLSDDTSKPTIERPVVALIESYPQRLELYPKPESGDVVEMTYVTEPSMDSAQITSTTIVLPPKIKNAFIYYLAFLVLSAYGDSRAQMMYSIAKMELGMQGTEDSNG